LLLVENSRVNINSKSNTITISRIVCQWSSAGKWSTVSTVRNARRYKRRAKKCSTGLLLYTEMILRHFSFHCLTSLSFLRKRTSRKFRSVKNSERTISQRLVSSAYVLIAVGQTV